MRNGDLITLSEVRPENQHKDGRYKTETLLAGLASWGDIESLDAPLDALDEKTLNDCIRSGPTQFDDAVAAERREMVRAALAKMTPRQRQVIVARFWRDETLDHSLAGWNRSRERARQIELDAINALRNLLGADQQKTWPDKCVNGHDMNDPSVRAQRRDGTWRCRACARAKRKGESLRYCRNGHDTWETGRVENGKCAVCCRVRKANYEREKRRIAAIASAARKRREAIYASVREVQS